MYELFHPDCHAGIGKRIHQLRNLNETAPVAEAKVLRFDGQAVDVDVLAAPFSFRGANDIHVILRDITGRKQMEQALISSRDLLIRLAEQVPGVVYQYQAYPDGRTCFPYASPGMEEIYEITPEEVREDAALVASRLHPEDLDRIVAAIQESARSQTLFHIEYRVVLPRQGLRWRFSDAKPQRVEDGSTIWYGMIMDITDRKLAEQQINAQLDELRRWHAILLGRENRIIELKAEVNQVLLQAGHKPRYQPLDRSSELPDNPKDADWPA